MIAGLEVRIFAYHLCKTPPVERTVDAFDAHSMSVVVPPTANTYVRLKTSGCSNTAGSPPGFDTHHGQLGDRLVWTDWRRADGRGRRIPVARWPSGRDDGGPYGSGWTMGRRFQQTRGGALAGQAITTYAANAAAGNIHAALINRRAPAPRHGR